MLILLACVLSAILGRMGGSGNYPRQMRIIGIPLLTLGCLSFLQGGHLALVPLIISFGLMAGALSTYWDFLFGYDNYWFHGFVVGLSLAPVAGASGHLFSLIPAVVLTTVWMGGWSKLLKRAVVEELVRYCIIPLAAFTVR